MTGPYLLLRVVMGGLCIFFAYFLGRSLSERRDGRATNTQVMRWVLRAGVTAMGTAWGGLERVAVLLLALAVLAAGYGFYAGQRPRPPEEDLTRKMFHEE
ncbi:MAG TPA: hypothetical protein VLH09_00960 [Bryobacteraceae bacterium]|nr:hypothetical protein [Bryobacteraceae bacterium]